MTLLEFIFQDIWHFLGTWILLDVTAIGIASVVKEIRRAPR